MRVLEFTLSDQGATTIDWVVISAGLVGLGVAVASAVVPATHFGADSIRVSMICGVPGTICEGEHFTNGRSTGWTTDTGGEVVVTDLFGFDAYDNVLGPLRGGDGSQEISRTFEIPEGASGATFSLDVLASGSWDDNVQWGLDEGPRLYIGGQEIAKANGGPNGQGLTWTFHTDVPGVTATLNEQQVADFGGMSEGGSTARVDSISNVSITVDNPSGPVTLGMGVKSTGEYAGFDNIQVSPL